MTSVDCLDGAGDGASNVAMAEFKLQHFRRSHSSSSLTRNLSSRRSTTPLDVNVNGSPLAQRAAAVQFPSAYTSLKDIISSSEGGGGATPPTAGGSQLSRSGGSGNYEIKIKNQLLNKAAYAYLQPTPSGREAEGQPGLLGLICRFFFGPFEACFEFIGHVFRPS